MLKAQGSRPNGKRCLALHFALTAIALGALAARGSAQGFEFGFGATQPEKKLVEQFDADGDKRLNTAERRAARAAAGGPTSRPGRMGSMLPTSTPGPRLTPGEVETYGAAPVYDLTTLRTFFLQFEEADWEEELMAFFNTDVEVPATLTVEGTTLRDIGVHFRGNTSYRMVPEGYKH